MAAGDGIRDRWEARRGGIGSSVAAIPRDPREIARWAGRWLIVIAAGWLLDLAGMPVAWLIGPMIAAVVLALRGTPPGPNPQPVFTGVQAVIGIALSASFSTDALAPLADHWPVMLLTIFLVLGVSIAAGVALGRMAALDPATASLGTVPGGASGMVAMSEELGADPRIVAFMQYARVVIVVISIAILARIAGHESETALALVEDEAPLTAFQQLLVAPVLALLGIWVGQRFRLPSGGLIGAIIVGMVVGVLGWGPITFPPVVLAAAYLLLGTRIGSRFDPAVLRKIRDLLPYVLGFILLMTLLSAGLGWVLAEVTGIDIVTALLATSPGGMDGAMIAALDTGANVPLVLAVQISRLLLMVIAGPFVVRRLVKREATA
jgi:membrane AbrB-like protein